MLNALYVSLFHNKCGMRAGPFGDPELFLIESGEVIGPFPDVAPREVIDGSRRMKKALDEMQYLLERHGYALRRGNHFGRRFLCLCDIRNGVKPVAEIGQIIPDRDNPSVNGIDWRAVGGAKPEVSIQ